MFTYRVNRQNLTVLFVFPS